MIAALSTEHEDLAVVSVTPVAALVPTLLVATIVNRYVVSALSPVIVVDTCVATLLAGLLTVSVSGTEVDP